MNESLSVPKPFKAPRPLSAAEIRTLRAVADQLIPCGPGLEPAATDEPGYDDALQIAAHARADAFDRITTALADLDALDPGALDRRLRELAQQSPDTFQPLSTIVAGAWLLLPSVRTRISYPGQRRNVAPFGQAADELSSGILDPVLDRGKIFVPTDHLVLNEHPDTKASL